MPDMWVEPVGTFRLHGRGEVSGLGCLQLMGEADMNDMTTLRTRPVRPARPKPLPLYLSPTWRTDAPAPAPVDGGALLAKARAGRIRALASCKGARRLAALVPVEVVWASPSFRARIEAIAARSVVTA